MATIPTKTSPSGGQASSNMASAPGQPHNAEREVVARPGGLMLVVFLLLMAMSGGGSIGLGVWLAEGGGHGSTVLDAESRVWRAESKLDMLDPKERTSDVGRNAERELAEAQAAFTVATEEAEASQPPVAASVAAFILMGIVGLSSFICLFGCFTVAPNEARVLQFFGRYIGTVKATGLRWACPFYTKHSISLRVRNFESSKLKVNDHDGSPIEIAAVVVWRVVDTAEALFEVDNYNNYIEVQSEAALRNLATQYPYDGHQGELSLRANAGEIAVELQREVQERLSKAGIEVMEARISHLAYAPEIAAAMLRRQQASAVIAARQKIVEGAVGMVEQALAMLDEKDMVELDAERRANMVSNLLVVLCSDHDATPVINAGTIH